jgi:hypothetical protein
MAFPTTKVEISFTASPYERNPAAWVDVTSYVRSISIRRGRTGDLEQFPTGTASVTLDNRDRRFDPFNTAGPYYGDLTPRRQIQVTADTGSGFVPVFRGWVAGWPIKYTDAKFDVTTVLECFDVLGLIAEEQTLGDVPAYFGSNIFRFRMNEPVGSSVFTSEPSTVGGVTSTYELKPGGLPIARPFTSVAPLAPAFPFEAARIGQGNSWDFQGPVNFSPVAEGGSLSLWLARDNLGLISFPIQFNWGTSSRVNTFMDDDGTLEVDFFTGTTKTSMKTNRKVWTNFAAHHLYLCMFHVAGVPNFRIFVDGEDVTTLVSTSTTTTSIGSYGFLALIFDLYQDIIFEPETSPGLTYTDHATRARLYYGSGVNNAPETSRAKAERVLSRSNLPTAWQSLDTNSESTLGTQGANSALLNELQKIADSEGGELFATKDGLLRMTNRSKAAANGAGTTLANFVDAGSGIPYGRELSINISADEIINRLDVIFAGGGELTSDNTASITANGVAQTSLETYLATKADAVDFGNNQVQIFGQPVPQFSALEVSTTQSLADWATILNLELLDKITLTLTPKAGAAITQPLIVNSITHDITPGQWVSSIQGSARYIGWFIIGESLIGGPDLLV